MANPKVFDFKAFDFKARHFKTACLAMRSRIKEIGMVEHGDDAAHCSNGLTAQKFRDVTGEERAIYSTEDARHHRVMRRIAADRRQPRHDESFQRRAHSAVEPFRAPRRSAR